MKHNQHGAVTTIMFLFTVMAVLLVVVIIFAGWAFSSREVYKNKADQQAQRAVAVEKTQLTNQLNADFIKQENQPLATYSGPEVYGSLNVEYPKTWSAYIDATGQGAALIDGYFQPGIIPAIEDTDSIFALRVQVVNTPYSQSTQQFSGGTQSGTDTVVPYSLPKVPNVVGVEITGILPDGKSGTMVMFPDRSETIEVWTESNQYLSDFTTYILPNLSFSP